VWDVGHRGISTMLVAEFSGKWGQAQSCTSCGKCVKVCPTGALAEKGFAVEEMVKTTGAVVKLAARRGAHA
jgi:bidirectional [NiFe] hydrogenase diaphorase subunit